MTDGPPLIAGVCADLARRLAVDVSLVRVGFVLFSVAWGLGVVMYAGLWFLQLGSDWKAFGHSLASRFDVARRALAARVDTSRGDARTLGLLAFGLVAAGGLTLAGSFGLFRWVTPIRAIGLGTTLAGATVMYRLARSGT